MQYIILLFLLFIITRSISQNIRTIELTISYNTRYQCVDPQCSPIETIFVSTLTDCQIACLSNSNCRTVIFDQSNSLCEIFTDIIRQYGDMISAANVVTLNAIDNRQLSALLRRNWLINGDAETGPCASDGSVVSPTVWEHSGLVTQAYYNNIDASLMSTDPGPIDRGNRYFYGQTSSVTTMWQTRNITSFIYPLVDNQTVWFNFSAWLGGYYDQDDNARAALTFFNETNHIVGNITTIGPVLLADRARISSLLFRQANGLVPIGACSFEVLVTLTRINPTANDGDIDNIAFVLHQ